MKKYRIKNAKTCFMITCYKVQVKKWNGWKTIKTFEGHYIMSQYLEFCAKELLDVLERESMFYEWRKDMEYQRYNRIFKPFTALNDYGIKCKIRQGATPKYEGLMCVEDVCNLVFMDLDEIKSILNTKFIKGKALCRGCKNYHYEEVSYMKIEDFFKIVDYYQKKKSKE